MRALEALGATVETVPFVHGAYDSVFAKDGAVLARQGGVDRALLAWPLHAQRRAEQSERRAALEAAGVRVADPPATTLEGGDVVVREGGNGAYLGHGFRSSRASAAAVERFLDAPVTPLELRDPALYHLDMAVAVLGELTLVCEEALTPESVRAVERAEGSDRVLRVSLADARRFALNFVAVGHDVVLASGAPSFEATLRTLGYTPHAVELSEFHRAGGSAACLVARVHPLDRVADSRMTAMRSTAA